VRCTQAQFALQSIVKVADRDARHGRPQYAIIAIIAIILIIAVLLSKQDKTASASLTRAELLDQPESHDIVFDPPRLNGIPRPVDLS
jgi:hypothetical protein